jgi:hypothetical protein
LFEALQREA